jgi:hypothetical protein
MKKVQLLLLAAIMGIAIGYGQQVYGPFKTSWNDLVALDQQSASGVFKEIVDGNSFEDRGERNLELKISPDARIIRNKNKSPESSIGQMGLDAPAPLKTYLGLDDGNVRGISVIPPDTHGAVGESQVVTVTNAEIKVQDKATGASLGFGIIRLNTFFNSVNFGGGAASCFDPRVLYDAVHRRFLVITAVNGGNVVNSGFIVAVSQQGTATGTWTYYGVDSDQNDATWFDFPYVGLNKDMLVITGNMFTAANAFQYARIWAFSKLSMYDGKPIDYASNAQTFFAQNSAGSSMCVVNDYDNVQNKVYIVQSWSGNVAGSSYLRLSYLEGALPNLSLNFTGFIQNDGIVWSSSGGGNFAQQPVGSNTIDAGNSRMGNAVLVNGKIWCAHTVFVPLSAPTTSAISWYCLGTDGTILQNNVIRSDLFRYYPAIAVNKAEDVVIGYTISNLSTFASAAYTYRSASDPLHSTRTEYVFQPGKDYYYKVFSGTLNRWGDYSNAVVDPVDQTLWTVQEYAEQIGGGGTTPRWATQWAQVNSSAPMGPLPATLLSFEANLSRSKLVNLTWKAGSETQLKGYEVQRSKDGTIFEKIGFVAANNMPGTHSYTYNDREPLFGNSFYQLRMVNNDGGHKLSKARSINNVQPAMVLVGLSPNPVQSKLQFRLYAPAQSKIEAAIVNAAGQAVMAKIYPVQEGYYLDYLELGSLPAGNYFLRLASGGAQPVLKAFTKL